MEYFIDKIKENRIDEKMMDIIKNSHLVFLENQINSELISS